MGFINVLLNQKYPSKTSYRIAVSKKENILREAFVTENCYFYCAVHKPLSHCFGFKLKTLILILRGGFVLLFSLTFSE